MHFMSEKRDKAPAGAFMSEKDCEISEISEISPTLQGYKAVIVHGDKRDDNSAHALPLVGVPSVIRRASPLDARLRRPGARVCFPNCQNCSIKRTPGRPLFTR
jgi:hypothetical protein